MMVVHLLESVQIKIKNGPGISFRKGFPEEPHEPDAVRKPRQGIMVGHEGKELLAPRERARIRACHVPMPAYRSPSTIRKPSSIISGSQSP